MISEPPMAPMTAETVIQRLTLEFQGLVPKASWGETSLFYNPNNVLKNGVYFATIKEHDGENDKASQLDREGVFRLSFGLPPVNYEQLFGPRPPRPDKGGVVPTGHDFTALNELMPHPVYAWMSWVQVLSCTEHTLRGLTPLLTMAYEKARAGFTRRTREASTVNGG
jgi:hypothetical protein